MSTHDRHVRIHHEGDVNAGNSGLPFLMAVELKRADVPLLDKSKVRDLHEACLSVEERRGDHDALFGRLLQYTLYAQSDFAESVRQVLAPVVEEIRKGPILDPQAVIQYARLISS